MRKILFSIAAFSAISYSAIAGGLLTNTNQNVAFLRNIARDATIEIDAAYSNPAGLAFIEEGFHVSFNVQSAYQTRTIVSTFEPFRMNGGDATKTFKGDATAPFIPSLQAAYKKNNWTFSGNFAVTGGGGKATFDKGLASFESQIAMLPVMLSNPPYSIPTTQYSVENYMEGSQFVYGGQLGVTYKATDYLSAYVGGRFNYSQNRYVGYIRNIKINPNKPQYGLTGDMIPATAIPQLAEIAADKEVDCEQTGWGAAPILGLDLKAGKWNAAVKYEFNTFLTVKNQTKVDNTGKFPDGASIAQDIPALLTVGLEYSILPSLKAAAGYHYFFDKEARMENSKQNELDHGTYEILLGLEWNITKRILVSAGAQRTQYGVTDEYQSDMRFSLSSFSYGVGGAFLLTKDLKVNLAYFFTDYDDYTKKSAHYNGTPFSGEDVFKRTNHVFGLGIDYHF